MKRLKFGSLFVSLFIVALFSLCLANTPAFAGAWEERDGSSTGGGVSNNTGGSEPSLALDSSGNPHIAWYDYSGGDNEIYYRYWNPFIFICQCPADSFTGCASGQVKNSEGEPLAGKKVWFKGRLFPGGPGFEMKTRTDANGCYKFNLPEGIGKIWVKGCRGEGKKDVSVPFGEKVNGVDFECKKRRR